MTKKDTYSVTIKVPRAVYSLICLCVITQCKDVENIQMREKQIKNNDVRISNKSNIFLKFNGMIRNTRKLTEDVNENTVQTSLKQSKSKHVLIAEILRPRAMPRRLKEILLGSLSKNTTVAGIFQNIEDIKEPCTNTFENSSLCSNGLNPNTQTTSTDQSSTSESTAYEE